MLVLDRMLLPKASEIPPAARPHRTNLLEQIKVHERYDVEMRLRLEPFMHESFERMCGAMSSAHHPAR